MNDDFFIKGGNSLRVTKQKTTKLQKRNKNKKRTKT
jgi:hypothetical protein